VSLPQTTRSSLFSLSVIITASGPTATWTDMDIWFEDYSYVKHEAIQYKGRTLSIDVNICADAGQTGLAIRRIAYSIGKKKTSLQPRPYDFNVQRFGKKVPPGSTLLATARNESHRDGPSGLRSCNRRGGYYRWCGH